AREGLAAEALAEVERLAQAEALAHVAEGAGRDHRGAHAREVALGEVGLPGEQGVPDHEPEHGVAEELEPLVGRAPGLARGRVRERLLEQGGVGEAVPQALLQRLAGRAHRVGCTRPRRANSAPRRASARSALGSAEPLPAWTGLSAQPPPPPPRPSRPEAAREGGRAAAVAEPAAGGGGGGEPIPPLPPPGVAVQPLTVKASCSLANWPSGFSTV